MNKREIEKRLRDLETRLLKLLSGLNLKVTLERAADAGDIILEAKEGLPHGDFGPWLRRVNLNKRTAWDYMAVSKARKQDWWPSTPKHITIKKFLNTLRKSIREGMQADRELLRGQVAVTEGILPESIRLTHNDCRRAAFPTNLDAVVADPPWHDLDAYRWVADFAKYHLKPGGLLFVQSGTYRLPEVMALFPRLSYVWTMAIVYKEGHTIKNNGGFCSNWKPVIVFSNTERPKKPGTGVSDTFTVKSGEKDLHDWQQPEAPWRYWLERLLPPKAVVADPFAGSGTIGVVCRDLGMTYYGTEIDAKSFKVAEGRLKGMDRKAA